MFRWERLPDYITEHAGYYALNVGNAEQMRLITVGDRDGGKTATSSFEFIMYGIEVLEYSEQRNVVSVRERVTTWRLSSVKYRIDIPSMPLEISSKLFLLFMVSLNILSRCRPRTTLTRSLTLDSATQTHSPSSLTLPPVPSCLIRTNLSVCACR